MSLDRLERRLPEVLTELSLPRMPDYVDDLLGRTERMSQRPGWTYLERWIPLSTFTATLSRGGRLPLRPLIAVALVIALIVAAVALYIGTQKRPPLFGPAGNGLIVTSGQGDIIAVDPRSGARSILIAGEHLCCVSVSPDGQYISYLDIPVGSDEAVALRVATVDGHVVAELPAEQIRGLESGEWSPKGDRLVLATASGVSTFDVATRQMTDLDISVPFPIRIVSWIGASDDLLITAQIDSTPPESVPFHVYLYSAATASVEEIAVLEDVVEAPALSPDGSKFRYVTWGSEVWLEGRIHVFDLATRIATAITPDDEASNAVRHSVFGGAWSPDSKSIAAVWAVEGYDQLAIIPAAGGDPVFLGPREPQGFGERAKWRFSPDGETLLVQYGDRATTLLLPVSGAEARVENWALTDEIDWQRRAP